MRGASIVKGACNPSSANPDPPTCCIALPRLERMTVDAAPSVDSSTRAILDALPYAWLIVLDDFRILDLSEGARAFNLASTGTLGDRGVRRLVTNAIRTQKPHELDLELRGAVPGAASRFIRVRSCPLNERMCALLIEDVSHAMRVDAMRRDFIVNVSHELKTPVGALLLLAEAVKSASDDVISQQRFVNRMRTEAERLSRLVNDLSDLSRLQSDAYPVHGNAIPVSRIVAEAVDSVRLIAQRREITFIVGNFDRLQVQGNEEQLVTALRNLLTNAIAYSAENTRVSVSGRLSAGIVEISVTDQGIGISESDRERIFERFYRVDPARSRATGGTGLGLSIVKHICASHGGECVVWSEPGEGSTFTLRLPAASAS